MNEHPVTFEDLIDRLDGRLDPARSREVEAHIAGCSACRASLAWLARFKDAARMPAPEQPPARAAAQVKASYRKARRRPALRRLWAGGRPRPAAGFATLLLLLVASALLFQVPAVLAQGALLSFLSGSAEVRPAGSTAWQPAIAGRPLREGDALRLAEGTAELSLFDGSHIELQAGAQLTLATLRASLSRQARRIEVRQEAGTARYEVVAGVWPSGFCVRTVAANAWGDASAFSVAVAADGETQVAALRGTVRLAGALDGALLVPPAAASVAAGTPVQLRPSPPPAAGPTVPAPASPTPGATAGPKASSATPRPTPRTSGMPAASATPVASATPRTSATPQESPRAATNIPESPTGGPQATPGGDDAGPGATAPASQPTGTQPPEATARPPSPSATGGPQHTATPEGQEGGGQGGDPGGPTGRP